jgi:hypothetical protein
VHESKPTRTRPLPRGNSLTNTVRFRATTFGHLIQDVARDHLLGYSPAWRASAKTPADDRFVPKEGVLHSGLPMVANLLLPPTAADLLHLRDRAIPRADRSEC